MVKYNTKELIKFLGYKHNMSSYLIYQILIAVQFGSLITPNKFSIRDYRGIYDSVLDCFNNKRILPKLINIYSSVKNYPIGFNTKITIDSKVIHQNEPIEIIIGYIR